MITLKTKTQFLVPFGRIFREEYIYLTVERLEIDINNITHIGFYYFIDENEQVQKLDDIKRNPKLWTTVEVAEFGLLSSLESSVHLKDNLLQRVIEFTFIQLEQEANLNYGTIASDWELLV